MSLNVTDDREAIMFLTYFHLVSFTNLIHQTLLSQLRGSSYWNQVYPWHLPCPSEHGLTPANGQPAQYLPKLWGQCFNLYKNP